MNAAVHQLIQPFDSNAQVQAEVKRVGQCGRYRRVAVVAVIPAHGRSVQPVLTAIDNPGGTQNAGIDRVLGKKPGHDQRQTGCKPKRHSARAQILDRGC